MALVADLTRYVISLVFVLFLLVTVATPTETLAPVLSYLHMFAKNNMKLLSASLCNIG